MRAFYCVQLFCGQKKGAVINRPLFFPYSLCFLLIILMNRILRWFLTFFPEGLCFSLCTGFILAPRTAWASPSTSLDGSQKGFSQKNKSINIKSL